MSIKFEKKNDVGYLAVDDEMTIYTAAEQKEKLLGHLTDCHEIELNLSGVTEIDSAGLQLLMVMKNEACRLNKEVQFIQHSQPVVEIFELLKLAAHFSDPIVVPPEWQQS
ncbi:MAG: STAS domain-containing protein [Gammaproteobacteria bacterium]|nr:STAS domain-containing protein [Gammaproteobacteria bacterium]